MSYTKNVTALSKAIVPTGFGGGSQGCLALILDSLESEGGRKCHREEEKDQNKGV